ncbi:hypothetical protein GGTG_14183 [Gaeumannomyces tritici R3-111a-1]|uniref:MYND-type zinc finger protein samB n=1 Tax=Gaeumannomyces tritici (strain R3-111a-1) TaxID=644352 RepID=J3PKW1_GAET3|nr:hypothetical protein GGTG_14183 [Gaeumannomyces tritici R3-111a-1]EJT68240.1 hypothetical protein GGTG_14183 [Gaeumannomyces tritici R3-111a-1]
MAALLHVALLGRDRLQADRLGWLMGNLGLEAAPLDEPMETSLPEDHGLLHPPIETSDPLLHGSFSADMLGCMVCESLTTRPCSLCGRDYYCSERCQEKMGCYGWSVQQKPVGAGRPGRPGLLVSFRTPVADYGSDPQRAPVVPMHLAGSRAWSPVGGAYTGVGRAATRLPASWALSSLETLDAWNGLSGATQCSVGELQRTSI